MNSETFLVRYARQEHARQLPPDFSLFFTELSGAGFTSNFNVFNDVVYVDNGHLRRTSLSTNPTECRKLGAL